MASYSIDWSSLEQSVTRTDTLDLPSLLQFLFWAGATIMGIRFIRQLFSITDSFKNRKKNTKRGKHKADKRVDQSVLLF